MIQTLFFVDELLCIISIFALVFFCAIVPKTSIAKYFYLLFGITLIPIGIRMVVRGEAWYVFIWVFLFSLVAILVGIALWGLDQTMTKEQKEELDGAFGDMARRSGARRISRQFWKR